MSRRSVPTPVTLRAAYTDETTRSQRKTWAQAIVDRATRPIPPYGTAEWLALSEDDPRRIAAVVLAAEAWAWDWEHLEGNMRAEVEGLQANYKRLEDAAYVAAVEAHRRAFPGGSSESHEARRQRQLMAARPRPGDFQGRGRA